ncbi:MAG TPA: hypothetical protein VJH92_02000 [Candidatus Nanoarchaeia archaeon]|nr:hypothetical protein [Candidatus Nanoarchaeia archaeon]
MEIFNEGFGDRNPLIDLIDEHSSMLLIRDSTSKERMLIGEYDDSYPKESYRLRVNLLGGAEDDKDRGARQTLERELEEEFAWNGQKSPNKGFIDDLRQEISKNAVYHGVFESFFLSYPGGPRKNYSSIDTAYISEIDRDVFDKVGDYLKLGLRISTEGNLALIDLNQLRSGEVLTAWDTGKILSDIYGVPIPNPDNVFCRKLKIDEIKDYTASREKFYFK